MDELSTAERSVSLLAISACMGGIGKQTEQLISLLIYIDPDKSKFPSMWKTAATLAEVSAGWAFGGSAGTCGCGRLHPAGAAMCYVCDLPLCQHPGDGCPYACECGCGECEALQARLRGDEP